VANFGTGPVQDGLGLFHVIGSYCGQFVVSATSCRTMMPDPDFYRQCLLDSFNELLAGTQQRSKKPSRKTPKAKAKAKAKTKAKGKK
jgi:diacylglycerol O-acyltransferase